MRRAVANRLLESKQQSPHWYLKIQANMSNFVSFRQEINKMAKIVDGKPEYKISANDIITMAVAKALKKQFMDLGEIKGVNDHLYVTNSYHVNPAEKINAFDKLRIEGQFLQLSKGGAVSYVECSTDLDKNIPAIETLFRYMYDNILYSELNFTNEDYCDNCGYHGELILDNTKDGKFLFHCPKCNCFDATKLHAPRRLCGYLGEVANGIGPDSPNANQGRLEDIYSRVKHI